MPEPRKFLIVDDEPHVRRYLGMLLEDEFDDAVIATAGSGADALEAYAADRPDLVLLDINMVGMDGLETLHALRERDPAAQVVMVTSVDVRRAVEQALIDGAVGYILKDTPMDKLAENLRALAANLRPRSEP